MGEAGREEGEERGERRKRATIYMRDIVYM